MVNRHTVGNGPRGKEPAKLFSSAKQVYLFGGLIAIGEAVPALPASGNYQIKTSHNVVDWLVTGLTGNLISLRTVKIRVKEGEK